MLIRLMSLFALTAVGVAQTDAEEREKLEQKFQTLMSGCRMVGQYTLDGSGRPPGKDTYTITKVEKVRGDRWRFFAQIEYADKNVTLPLTVTVKWAGDTPMIQVTDMNVPLLGKYSARVLIHGDQYAGTWNGVGYGGAMFGKIEPLQVKAKDGAAQQWRSWRGPKGTGESPGATPPIEWGEDKNVAWKLDLPGLGSSTPIVLGDRVYLTTAVATERDGEPTTEEPPAGRGRRRGRGGFGGGAEPATKIHEFRVLCVDRGTGKILWNTMVKEAVPHERGHATASQASNSPVTDGEYIYAFFGSRGMHCLNLRGEVVWSKDFPLMWTRNRFGEGASPALHGDTLVVNCDHEGESFIVALDKTNGDERWRQVREEVTSWSTPLVIEVGGRPQVVVTATGATRAYDLATGEVIWELSGMTLNAIPSPMFVDERLYLMSGFRGSNLQCVDPKGAAGDLRGTDKVLWSHGQGTSYVPSALIYDGRIYFLRVNSGVLTCLDAKTGEAFFEGEKMRGVRTIYASPVAADGKIFIASREGVVKVLQAGDTYVELAENKLDDTFDATPVLIGDQILLRGANSLYCVQAKD